MKIENSLEKLHKFILADIISLFASGGNFFRASLRVWAIVTMSQADKKKWLHSLSLAAVQVYSTVHVHCTATVHPHFPLDLFTGQGPRPVLCLPLPGMTSHCNQGQTSLKYFPQSNLHKYLVHKQRMLLG